MSFDVNLREYSGGDIPALCALWESVFGDKPELIQEFFRLLPDMGFCAVAELDGKIAGMASVLTALELVTPCADAARCGYVYAVATAPSFRGRGIGAALTEKVCALAKAAGASVLCTLPAEDSLYPWYEKIMGVRCALYRQSFETSPAESLPVRRLKASEYLKLREELLADKSHLRAAAPVVEFAEQFYSVYGGGLFLCGESLCAAYGDAKCLYIKELISPDGRNEPAAAALGAFLGADRIVYSLPSESGDKYISALPDALPSDCVWNLSFD